MMKRTRCERNWIARDTYCELQITVRSGAFYSILFDAEDEVLLRKHVWSMNGSGRPSAAIDGKQVEMHRLILGHPDGSVDHINRNPRDNRKQNLRICTHQQNMRNRSPHRQARVPYKGVFQRRFSKRPRYRVRIRAGERLYSGGSFTCPIEAAKKYDEMVLQLHGEFACTNKSMGLI